VVCETDTIVVNSNCGKRDASVSDLTEVRKPAKRLK
jgi:hypothetical protein